MLKKLISFLNRQIVTIGIFIYAYLFYLGYDMTGLGIELTERKKFVEHAWFWFYFGIIFFIATEVYTYYDKNKTMSKSKNNEPLFCLIGRIFFGICILLHFVNIIDDYMSVACTILLLIFVVYCFKIEK